MFQIMFNSKAAIISIVTENRKPLQAPLAGCIARKASTTTTSAAPAAATADIYGYTNFGITKTYELCAVSHALRNGQVNE